MEKSEQACPLSDQSHWCRNKVHSVVVSVSPTDSEFKGPVCVCVWIV